MSTFDADDLETTGYFLPEDSQYRLTKLRDYAQFLSRLAEPRTADEELDWSGPEIRASEVAICLELLAEQVGQVLDELSYPAERGDKVAAPEAKAEVEAEPKVSAFTEVAADTDDTEPELGWLATNEAGKCYVSGVTLDQIDELARLGDILRAHGDVVVATDQADFADVTLSIMGDAIIRDAERLRDIIHDVDSVQRLDGRRRSHADVREEAASYLAVPACAPLRGISRPSARLTVVGPLGGGERAAALAYVQPAI
ncbi:hypothetical protein B0E46_05105 [Rhodanobacter sp. B04]|uniref:XAC0095 family protein n=1 Tax=Rhodanobacter sp. B04 TaxID=1945860 RepID=UPI000987C4A3|nr:hypothetical protein [Rhodanobacter sp. B04]OOG64786.1 hypothetical protein B0E46_05105 [Rhodanobacter sp. B04]